MSLRHKPLDEVVAGDVLAEDLVDAGGHVLLARSAVLSAATLSGLRRRGVETLAVEVAEAPDAGHQAARRLIVEQELCVRFRRAGRGEATRLLFQATLEYLLERPE